MIYVNLIGDHQAEAYAGGLTLSITAKGSALRPIAKALLKDGIDPDTLLRVQRKNKDGTKTICFRDAPIYQWAGEKRIAPKDMTVYKALSEAS